MRIALFLPVFILVGALVAWIHEEAVSPLRIVVVESLAEATAEAVVPVFKGELVDRLAAGGRMATFERLHIARRADAAPEALALLATADLVVSFGPLAAEAASAALRATSVPHLFAFVPRQQALVLTDAAARPAAAVTGVSGQLPRGAAYAIAERLLATRTGAPLRIGLLHQVLGGNPATTSSLLAGAVDAPGFLPIPVTTPPDSETEDVMAAVVAAAVRAAAGEQRIEAFWLALDASAPLALVVQAIEAQTGQPVIYAPGEAAVAAGALMSLAAEPSSTARETAALAVRLLDGARPSELSLRAPHRVEFALNLETADLLGIIPPHEVLELARGRLFR